jgi:hypothetical protein
MSDAESLQFERAEFDQTPGEAQCTECKRPLAGSYFDVNGQMVCEACRYGIESRHTAGSGASRFVRAFGAGAAAALGGALLYYAILALTGYEIGLIAIAVGYGVGVAVRWGANARGGWLYQALAIGLTYLAITTGYFFTAAFDQSMWQADTAATVSAAPSPTASAADATGAAPTGTPSTLREIPVGLRLALLFAIALISPFLGGFENIIGLIIIAIGLYEAWKLNQRTELTITGPHVLARPTAVTAEV